MNVFDKHVKEYDQWYDRNKFAYLSEVEALKQMAPKDGKGLEIGVGTGRFAQALGVSVGIDPSENMLQIARERGLRTFTGKGENLPFDDKEFDFTLIVITLCFVNNPEQVIKESRRVLKENGEIIIGIIDKDSHLGKFYQEKKIQGHRFYKEVNFFSTEDVLGLLIKYEFIEIRTYQTIFHSLENMEEIEQFKEGYGEGGFVVIGGKKK